MDFVSCGRDVDQAASLNLTFKPYPAQRMSVRHGLGLDFPWKLCLVFPPSLPVAMAGQRRVRLLCPSSQRPIDSGLGPAPAFLGKISSSSLCSIGRERHMGLRIGIDTGGTFTDVVVFNDADATLRMLKVHSTPEDPGIAVVHGVVAGAALAKVDPAKIQQVVHGTTVATNAILQRVGARVALVTTEGFGDVLHIQRQNRPSLYDMRTRRAEPLVPRHLRFEFSERMRHDATVERAPALDDMEDLVVALRDAEIEAVAVCFLHSDLDPRHERSVGRFLAERLPDTTICLSHALSAEEGEYERFSTCAMNAFVQPVMQRYLGRLSHRLQEASVGAPVLVMKSNGGVTSVRRAAAHCVQTILSGPAGAAVAGAAIAGHHANPNLITADMGGTSFDVAVVESGTVGFSRQTEIAGLAIQVPLLDLHTVGAGGGSIGWLDAGNALRVGPHSAGAVPGPACYGRGGTEPTVTDANLVLGRLRPDSALAGGMMLDLESARRAIHDRLAAPTGLTLEQVAEGMIRVVNTTMVAAIRRLTVERGLDARRFCLCAFGGAGPLHGAELAREMGIAETLIPLEPGVTSALGLLMSSLREDRVRTFRSSLDDIDLAQLETVFEAMEREAREGLEIRTPAQSSRRLGLRYVGQRYDLSIELAPGAVDLACVTEAFHAAHERRFGFARRDEAIELVNVWISEEAEAARVRLPEIAPGIAVPDPAGSRSVIFGGQAYETPLYARCDLGAGSSFDGPAVVEQEDTTVVVLPGQTATVDRYGHLLLRGNDHEGTAG